MSDTKETKNTEPASPALPTAGVDRTPAPTVPVVIATVETLGRSDPTARPLPAPPVQTRPGPRGVSRPSDATRAASTTRPPAPVRMESKRSAADEERDELIGKVLDLAATTNRAEYIKRFSLDLTEQALRQMDRDVLMSVYTQVNNIPTIRLLEDVISDALRLYQPRTDPDLSECIQALKQSNSLQEPWSELKAVVADVLSKTPEALTGLQAIAGKLRLRVLASSAT